MANPQKGSTFDVVLTVRENAAVANIATATSLKIYVEKPNNSVLNKTATLVTDGTDGKLKVSVTALENDQAGFWEAQAEFTLGAFAGRTSKGRIMVERNVGE